MTQAEARSLVLDRIGAIAPDAALDTLAGDADLREELDLDSMDALTLLEELAAAIGTDIPDRDAARLRTLNDLVAYAVASARQPTH
jgi:acyl carrier protein